MRSRPLTLTRVRDARASRPATPTCADPSRPTPGAPRPQPSAQALTEAYRVAVPIFAPAVSLLCEWGRRGTVFPPDLILGPLPVQAPDRGAEDAGVATDGADLGDPSADGGGPATPRARNATTASSAAGSSCFEWASLLDPYPWPHVRTFASWEALLADLRDAEALRETSRRMREHNRATRADLAQTWADLISRGRASGVAAAAEAAEIEANASAAAALSRAAVAGGLAGAGVLAGGPGGAGGGTAGSSLPGGMASLALAGEI